MNGLKNISINKMDNRGKGRLGEQIAADYLQKKKIKLDGFEMNISADVQETHPQVYTKIHLEYVFYGKDIPKDAVERAIKLSQDTYCSVTAMLQKAVEINHSYKIIES